MGMTLYIVTKFVAYTAWCFLGMRMFGSGASSGFGLAAVYGGVRLLMGVGLGLLIFLAALSMNNATRNAPLTYAAIYVPVRALEWTIMYFIIRRDQPSLERAFVWVAGGIVISCLADIPLGIMNHGVVPAGRPFC
jgi:hypothetical protein